MATFFATFSADYYDENYPNPSSHTQARALLYPEPYCRQAGHDASYLAPSQNTYPINAPSCHANGSFDVPAPSLVLRSENPAGTTLYGQPTSAYVPPERPQQYSSPAGYPPSAMPASAYVPSEHPQQYSSPAEYPPSALPASTSASPEHSQDSHPPLNEYTSPAGIAISDRDQNTTAQRTPDLPQVALGPTDRKRAQTACKNCRQTKHRCKVEVGNTCTYCIATNNDCVFPYNGLTNKQVIEQLRETIEQHEKTIEKVNRENKQLSFRLKYYRDIVHCARAISKGANDPPSPLSFPQDESLAQHL